MSMPMFIIIIVSVCIKFDFLHGKQNISNSEHSGFGVCK